MKISKEIRIHFIKPSSSHFGASVLCYGMFQGGEIEPGTFHDDAGISFLVPDGNSKKGTGKDDPKANESEEVTTESDRSTGSDSKPVAVSSEGTGLQGIDR